MYGSVKEQTSAIASGDTEAFAHLFRERFDDMFAEARRATGRDESFCLDVVQDAMLRVTRSMKAMDTDKRLRAWLRVVVQSCAYDRLRSEARRRRRELATVADKRADPTDTDLDERLEWLRGELAAMDTHQAHLLLMRYRLGWTLERMGQALGLKPGAVDGRVRRAVSALRRRAREAFDE